MDTDADKAVFVHLPDKIVRFGQMRNRLCGLDPKNKDKNFTPEEYNNLFQNKNFGLTTNTQTELFQESNTNNKTQFIQTVKENLKYLSPAKQERAKKARQVYQALGTPTTEDFKAMIRMNLINNNKVTAQDTELAEKVCGPDTGSIKGKSARSKPKQAIPQDIDLPKELVEINEDITLSVDGLNVNKVKFITSIAHDLYYRTSQPLPPSNDCTDLWRNLKI